MLLLLLSCFSRVWLCATPQTAARQAPPSLGFSRREHWSGLPFPSPLHESEKWKWSRAAVYYSSRPHGLQPTRLLHPWDFPGKSTGVGCHCLLRLRDGTSLNYSSKGSMDESVGGIHFFPAWFLRPFTTLVCIGNFPNIFLYIWYVFCLIFFCVWFFVSERKWHPTPVFLPGESQGQGSLVGCRLWGCTESDTTEVN